MKMIKEVNKLHSFCCFILLISHGYIITAQEVEDYKNVLFETKIEIVDIEVETLISHFPPFIIKNEIEEERLVRYLEFNPINKFGEYEFIVCRFKVKKSFTIQEMYTLVKLCKKYVSAFHAEFSGVLSISFNYSSKSDDYLEVPPLPPSSIKQK